MEDFAPTRRRPLSTSQKWVTALWLLTALFILACGGGGAEMSSSGGEDPTPWNNLAFSAVGPGGSKTHRWASVPDPSGSPSVFEAPVEGGTIHLGPERADRDGYLAVVLKENSRDAYSIGELITTGTGWRIDGVVPVPVTGTMLSFGFDRQRVPLGWVTTYAFEMYSGGSSQIYIWRPGAPAPTLVPNSRGGRTPAVLFEDTSNDSGEVVWSTGTELKVSKITDGVPGPPGDLAAEPVRGWSPTFRNARLYFIGTGSDGKTYAYFEYNSTTFQALAEVPASSSRLRASDYAFALNYSPDEYGSNQKIRVFSRKPGGPPPTDLPQDASYLFVSGFLD